MSKTDKQLLADFLKAHSIDDVKKNVRGELHEFATDDASYWYGNGELIVSPADESQDESTYSVTNVRGFDELLLN